MRTDLTGALTVDPGFDRAICARTPARHWGDPRELIGAAIFLAPPASDFVNGQILFVDGGLLAALETGRRWHFILSFLHHEKPPGSRCRPFDSGRGLADDGRRVAPEHPFRDL